MIRVKRAFDLAVVCISGLASIALSSGAFSLPSLAEILVIRIKVSNLFLFLGYLALCSSIFSACGFYRSHRLSHRRQRLSEILIAMTLATAVLLGLGWLVDLSFAGKEFLVVFWFLSVSSLMLSHEVAQRVLHLARLHGRNLRHIIVVGEGEEAMALAHHIRKEAGLGYHVVRVIDARETAENGRLASDL